MPLRDRLILGVVAVVLALCARYAAADPVTVTWTNTADEGFPPATRALLCVGQFCSMADTMCAPGATCETTHNLAPGTYEGAELMVSAPQFGLAWSVPVPGAVVIPAANPTGGVCQHDADGNGVVTTADFGSFWNEFRNGCD